MRASVSIAMLVMLTGCPIGVLDHIALDYIVGWACDSENFARNVPVEIYATGVTGATTCLVYEGTEYCKVANGSATHRREPTLADTCGGNANRGYRIVTPAVLLDGQPHEVIAVGLTDDVPPKPVKLGNPRIFDSDVLYEQERITNIDEHILLTDGLVSRFPNLPANIPGADVNFYSHNHTLFVYHRGGAGPLNPFSDPFTTDASGWTGFQPPEPLERYQRGIPTLPPVLAQAAGATVGVSMNPLALEGRSILVQHSWRDGFEGRPNVRPFRSMYNYGLLDRIQVRGRVRQPRELTDALEPRPPYSLDNMSFWYYVLAFKDTTSDHLIWWSTTVYFSRTANAQIWQELSDGNHQRVKISPPDPVNFPNAPKTHTHIDTPLSDSPTLQSWVVPCPGSSLFHQDPHADERLYCFELQGFLLSLLIEQHVNPQRAAAGVPPASVNVGDYELEFFVFNSEVFAIGLFPFSGLAYSVRDLAVEQIRWGQ